MTDRPSGEEHGEDKEAEEESVPMFQSSEGVCMMLTGSLE